ncbi:MAG: Na+/H+ antiporter NhaC family protein [Duodenibacillus sp.]|nr:Na+/H+ antiporter NhaC family protein [Duodenibacillus sp.]
MEFVVVALFCVFLAACVAAGQSVFLAMCAGLVLFVLYGLWRGCRARELAASAFAGVRLVWPVILILMLIGIISAAWRASGTIACIVAWAAGIVSPEWLLILAFWCNALMSFLTGTSFGTVSIMGVVFMSIGHAVGADPVIMAGAIVSGIYFGDRCSPMSSSAVFVAAVTGTSLYENPGRMLLTGAVPFAAASLAYFFIGMFDHPQTVDTSAVRALMAGEFSLSAWSLLPVTALGLLAFRCIKLPIVMLVSIAAAAAVALVHEGLTAEAFLSAVLSGYSARDAQLAAMMNGGGAASMLACNQLLGVMLTRDLCEDLYDRKRLAIGLENTSIVIAGLVPWSIASSVPLETLAAPASCLLYAFYVWLLPLWSLAAQALPAGRARSALGV